MSGALLEVVAAPPGQPLATPCWPPPPRPSQTSVVSERSSAPPDSRARTREELDAHADLAVAVAGAASAASAASSAAVKAIALLLALSPSLAVAVPSSRLPSSRLFRPQFAEDEAAFNAPFAAVASEPLDYAAPAPPPPELRSAFDACLDSHDEADPVSCEAAPDAAAALQPGVSAAPSPRPQRPSARISDLAFKLECERRHSSYTVRPSRQRRAYLRLRLRLARTHSRNSILLSEVARCEIAARRHACCPRCCLLFINAAPAHLLVRARTRKQKADTTYYSPRPPLLPACGQGRRGAVVARRRR